MKTNFLLALVLSCMIHAFSYAQSTSSDIGITVKALALDYISQNGGDFTAYNSYHTGMEIGFLKSLTENVMIGVPIKLAVVQSPDNLNSLHNALASIDGTVRYNFVRPDSKVMPYVFGGVGYVYESNGVSNLQIPAGIGFNFNIHNRAYITWQSEYRYALEDNRNNLHHGLGFTVFLGPKDPPKEEKEEMEEELPMEKEELDSDMDGIIDELDLCPQEAGLEELDGCPDTDGDGIADFKDLCPNEEGTMEMKGCPDSDGVVTMTMSALIWPDL